MKTNTLVMLGGLPEMVIWSISREYLEAFVWNNVLILVGIASSGTPDSFLRVSYLTITRRGHQINALAMVKLQEDAFLWNDDFHNEETKETWKQNMIGKSPTFQFWDTVHRMKLVGLIFVRTHREKNNSPLSIEPWNHRNLDTYL